MGCTTLLFNGVTTVLSKKLGCVVPPSGLVGVVLVLPVVVVPVVAPPPEPLELVDVVALLVGFTTLGVVVVVFVELVAGGVVVVPVFVSCSVQLSISVMAV